MILFLPFICTSVHGHRVVGTNIDCVLCVLLFACLFVCLLCSVCCFLSYYWCFLFLHVSLVPYFILSFTPKGGREEGGEGGQEREEAGKGAKTTKNVLQMISDVFKLLFFREDIYSDGTRWHHFWCD